MPVRIRNGAYSMLSTAISASWLWSRSSFSPWAIVSRAEWSVMTWYSWPRAMEASTISRSVAPPSDHVVWLCRSPLIAARISEPSVASWRVVLLQLGEVLGIVAEHRVGDDRRRRRADAVEVGELAGRDERLRARRRPAPR